MPSQPDLTVVVPVRLGGHVFQGPARLEAVVRNVTASNSEVLVVDDGTPDPHREPLFAVCEKYGVRVVETGAAGETFSIGRARNVGVQHARAPVVMFNDIDFQAPASVYRDIAATARSRELSKRPFRFFCVPVLFLPNVTEDVTRAALQGIAFEGSFREVVENLGYYERKGMRVTAGSSAMVVNRLHYLALGGHSDFFSGHGAEDFEFLHRLGAYYQRFRRSDAYYANTGSRPRPGYHGFRSYFGTFGEDLLSDQIALLHLWHPERSFKGYKRTRENFAVLGEAMKRFDRQGTQPLPLSDMTVGRTAVILRGETADPLESVRHLMPFFGRLRYANWTKDGLGGTALESGDVIVATGSVAPPSAREYLSNLTAGGLMIIDEGSDGGVHEVNLYISGRSERSGCAVESDRSLCRSHAHVLGGPPHSGTSRRANAFLDVQLPRIGAWTFSPPDHPGNEAPNGGIGDSWPTPFFIDRIRRRLKSLGA